MLKLSKNSGLTDIVTSGVLPYLDGSGNPTATPTNTPNPAYNPLNTTHPTTGSTVTTQIYLFNDDATKTYKSITIDPTDSVSTDESTWVQLSSDGSVYQAASAALTMADVTDTVGHSVWVKVVAPAVSGSQNKTDIKLSINAQEYAV